MTEGGRILIADDEETFLVSTIDLLRREGYECDGVKDAEAAVKVLSSKPFDLLISDIRMPGNLELELVEAVLESVKGLPVIIVTGYPSAKAAITCLHLRTIAYLVKPLDFDDFLKYVKTAVKSSQLNRDLLKIKQRLQDWNRSLEVIEGKVGLVEHDPSSLSISDFMTLTYQNITDSPLDLMCLAKLPGKKTETKNICHLLNCPRLDGLKETLGEAISVLEKTKTAFESKDLAEFRKKLEEVVKNLDRGLRS